MSHACWRASLVVVGLTVVAFAGGGAAPAPPAPSLRGLGHFADTAVTTAYGVSADGRVVVGAAANDGSPDTRAFRWTADGGLVELGGMPAGTKTPVGYGVSADGSVVVGSASLNNANFAFRWTAAGGMQRLPDLPTDFPYTTAWAVSAVGSVVVGSARDQDNQYAVARWDNGQVRSLGVLQPDLTGGTLPSASAVSADGSVLAGYSHSPRGTYEAVRWTAARGFVGLGDLPGGEFSSAAFGMSADGSTVVGSSESAFGRQAFRWTDATGMVRLGDLFADSTAAAASGDGSVVVGSGTDATGGSAFIWTADRGMRTLESELASLGVDTGGWRLISATAVTPDGLTIVGQAQRADRTYEAYIAVVPEPWTPALLLLPAPWALCRRRGAPGRPRIA